MPRYTIMGTVITTSPKNPDVVVTDEYEFTAEAPSYHAACRQIRAQYSSPYATVFIDKNQAKRDCEAVA